MSEASAVPTKVVGSEHDADFMTDLEIIARNEPGKGAALQRMIDRAGLGFRDAAKLVGYEGDSDTGRTTIWHWVSEKRWPQPDQLRKLLLGLNIDRKLLIHYFGIALGTELTPANESRQLAVTLRNELIFEFDEFERKDIIFNSLGEKILIHQGFKAINDTKAAIFFFERFDKHQEEKRLREQKSTRNVTPQASDWADGNVYEKNDTTTSSNESLETGDHNPGDELSPIE